MTMPRSLSRRSHLSQSETVGFAGISTITPEPYFAFRQSLLVVKEAARRREKLRDDRGTAERSRLSDYWPSDDRTRRRRVSVPRCEVSRTALVTSATGVLLAFAAACGASYPARSGQDRKEPSA